MSPDRVTRSASLKMGVGEGVGLGVGVRDGIGVFVGNGVFVGRAVSVGVSVGVDVGNSRATTVAGGAVVGSANGWQALMLNEHNTRRIIRRNCPTIANHIMLPH